MISSTKSIWRCIDSRFFPSTTGFSSACCVTTTSITFILYFYGGKGTLNIYGLELAEEDFLLLRIRFWCVFELLRMSNIENMLQWWLCVMNNYRKKSKHFKENLKICELKNTSRCTCCFNCSTDFASVITRRFS